MKTITKSLVFAAFLTLAWGCSSSDGDEDTKPTPALFTAPFSATPSAPDWHIDWSWHDAAPSWQVPDASKYEYSMNVLLELGKEFLPFSTDDDPMAVFIDGECRGVGYRNVYPDGMVLYLIHVKGHGEDTERRMELRYYNNQLKHQFVYQAMPSFTPNDLLDDPFRIIVEPGEGNSKYPNSAFVAVIMPDELPFTVTDGDMLASFVDGECRCVYVRNEELYSGWRGENFFRDGETTAQLRYYSAEKQGVYTIETPVDLTQTMQNVYIKF